MFHDHYDEMGNSRTYSGQINTFSPQTFGTTSEQWAAGVGSWDGPESAAHKVRVWRQNNGMDPYTGIPRYSGSASTAACSSSYSAGPGGFTVFKWMFLFAALIALIAAAPSLWENTGAERAKAAFAISAWGLQTATREEGFAPISAYEKYIPKKSAPLSTPAKDLNEIAKKILAPGKRASDKDIFYWGPAAWACIARSPNCLRDAGVGQPDARDIRMLGLLFLERAARKGSPEARADIGLYLISANAPLGKDPILASVHWEKAVQENPKALRPQRLLKIAKESPWAIGGQAIADMLLYQF